MRRSNHLHHVLSYTYPNVVLTLTGDERDIHQMTSETFADSDHAGDKGARTSISGALSFIMGGHGTKALIAWFAVKMRSSGISTGEVEVAAASVALQHWRTGYSSECQQRQYNDDTHKAPPLERVDEVAMGRRCTNLLHAFLPSSCLLNMPS